MTYFLICSVLIGIVFNIVLYKLDMKNKYIKNYNPKTDVYEHVPIFSWSSAKRWKVFMITGFIPVLNIAFLLLMIIDLVNYFSNKD